ncbi:MAG: DUF934 domain-containing protein [Rhodocyclaceae bacterium]|nr:DUF934 domain-containing protein [Rhodocyclaceae bacterium]
MAKIIKNRDIVEDRWTVLTLAANDTPQTVRLPFGPVLVPLSVWQARKEDLVRREWDQGTAFGVWLGPSDDPAAIAADLEDFSVVGVLFPKFTDGRGYSIATLLRTRYGYRGELRALGDIGRDQIHYLHRVGFDAYAIKEPELALASLDDFSEAYQAAANQPLPLFRRRASH